MKQFISNITFFFSLFSVLMIAGAGIGSDLNAETILLKSGEKLEGHIVSQDKETVRFKLEDGTVKTYPKSSIRKISFAKIPETNEQAANRANSKKEIQTSEAEKKETQDLEKQKAESEKLKSAEERTEKREREISDSKRRYFEASLGIGGGENQTELRPFYQTIQYGALFLGGSQSQSEILLTPYRTENTSSTARLYYAWNRFSFELRGTEAKGNLDVLGFQRLNFNNGGGGSQETSNNLILGNGNTKFQKVSSRMGFTPYPHPAVDLQILGGVERIWTKTTEEVYSLGEITPLGNNPNRFSFREYSNPLKGYSYGLAFEFKFLKLFSFQGQILHLEMKGPSSLRNQEFRYEFNRNFSQTGLDYQWTASGREVNLKFSYKISGNWSLFMEASNLILKNKLQSGYISDGDGGGNSDLSQEIPKLIGPRILIPVLYESKTSLSYLQIGVNYRFDF